MTSTVGRDMERPSFDMPDDRTPRLTSRTVSQLTWFCVIVGVGLRLARYGMNFPLWWDESFVATNFLRRGYFDLLRPLDYGQVCPLLFLWIELAVTKLLGFSEWTLRLFPLLCSVASLFLFMHLAKRLTSGVTLVLTVAIFAVSYHPIRHAADVKPYASDLLTSLLLIVLAVEWWRRPDRSGWLWGLVGFTPIALALSHPAVFVAGGIGLALACPVWQTGRLRVIGAWCCYLIAMVGTFGVLYVVFTEAQSDATLSVMQADWNQAFPPLNSVAALGRWLLTIHAGHLMAYPCGGAQGASALTLLLFCLGILVLVRQKHFVPVFILMSPFSLALVAAALHRYPYGGAARFMQYLAPSICLLTGVGASCVLNWVPGHGRRLRILRLGLFGLVVVGIVPQVGESLHPYRSEHALRARQFAQAFWPSLCRDAEVACLRWDLSVGEWNSIHLSIPVYLCNQKIYSPQRRRSAGPHWDEVSPDRPLRCVLSDPEHVDRIALQTWLQSMRKRFLLRSKKTISVNMSLNRSSPRWESYTIFEFIPRPCDELVTLR